MIVDQFVEELEHDRSELAQSVVIKQCDVNERVTSSGVGSSDLVWSYLRFF